MRRPKPADPNEPYLPSVYVLLVVVVLVVLVVLVLVLVVLTSREWKAGSAGNKSGFLNVAQPGPHGRPKMTPRAPTAARKSETNLRGTT